VQGTCHKRAWDGLQPAHGSPVSQVFFKNLHRMQARIFRISWADSLASLVRGPDRLPMRFSPALFFLLVAVLSRDIAGLVVLARGLTLLLRPAAESGTPEPDGGDVGDVEAEFGRRLVGLTNLRVERISIPAVGLTADETGESSGDCIAQWSGSLSLSD